MRYVRWCFWCTPPHPLVCRGCRGNPERLSTPVDRRPNRQALRARRRVSRLPPPGPRAQMSPLTHHPAVHPANQHTPHPRNHARTTHANEARPRAQRAVGGLAAVVRPFGRGWVSGCGGPLRSAAWVPGAADFPPSVSRTVTQIVTLRHALPPCSPSKWSSGPGHRAAGRATRLSRRRLIPRNYFSPATLFRPNVTHRHALEPVRAGFERSAGTARRTVAWVPGMADSPLPPARPGRCPPP